jgi:hypothetical protein
MNSRMSRSRKCRLQSLSMTATLLSMTPQATKLKRAKT